MINLMYIAIYLILVVITYGLYHNLSTIKSFKSDICYGQHKYHTKLRARNIIRSLFAPITTIALLLDIIYFVFFETKENFDSGVTKIWIEEKGKKKTREYLNVYFDVIPHYLEKLLK